MKLRYKIYYNIKGIPQGIKNLIRFLPTIWRLRWWDSWFLIILIQKQLQFMEENWVKNTIYEGAESDKKDIQLCINLINNLKNEDFKNLSFEEFYKKQDKDVELLFNTLKKYRQWWD